MHRIRTLTVLAATLAAVVTLLPDTAQAKRKSPLEGKPVVVRKHELRKLRDGITPFVGMSLSQPFVHKGYVGGKLHFDFTDWIGIKGMFAMGIINKDAKLLRGLNGEGGLPEGIPANTMGDMDTPANNTNAPVRKPNDFNNPAPLQHDFQAGLTRNQFLASLDVVFTPFSGKLGLFSGIFTEYDLYLFGGLGLSNWQKHYPNVSSTTEQLGNLNTSDASKKDGSYCKTTGATDSEVNRECFLHPVKADTGIKVGPSFGGGIHIFLADFAAINVDVQDIMSNNNLAGLNTTTTEVPPTVDKDDRNWNHNVMMSLGVTFYFPPKAKRSELKTGAKKKASK